MPESVGASEIRVKAEDVLRFDSYRETLRACAVEPGSESVAELRDIAIEIYKIYTQRSKAIAMAVRDLANKLASKPSTCPPDLIKSKLDPVGNAEVIKHELAKSEDFAWGRFIIALSAMVLTPLELGWVELHMQAGNFTMARDAAFQVTMVTAALGILYFGVAMYEWRIQRRASQMGAKVEAKLAKAMQFLLTAQKNLAELLTDEESDARQSIPHEDQADQPQRPTTSSEAVRERLIVYGMLDELLEPLRESIADAIAAQQAGNADGEGQTSAQLLESIGLLKMKIEVATEKLHKQLRGVFDAILDNRNSLERIERELRGNAGGMEIVPFDEGDDLLDQ